MSNVPRFNNFLLNFQIIRTIYNLTKLKYFLKEIFMGQNINDWLNSPTVQKNQQQKKNEKMKPKRRWFYDPILFFLWRKGRDRIQISLLSLSRWWQKRRFSRSHHWKFFSESREREGENLWEEKEEQWLRSHTLPLYPHTSATACSSPLVSFAITLVESSIGGAPTISRFR